MPALGRNKIIGISGDSISRWNGGGATAWWADESHGGGLGTLIRAQFRKSAPPTLPTTVGGVAAGAGLTVFDVGSPAAWDIQATSGINIGQGSPTIRSQIASIRTDCNILMLEGGTNDISNLISTATSKADMLGCFTDAIARFPHLEAVIVLSVMVIGELFQVVNGVPSFTGNATWDAQIDDRNTNALLAAVTQQQAADPTRSYTYVDIRTPAAVFVASKRAPPGVSGSGGDGDLTIDSKHPRPNGLDVVASAAVFATLTGMG